MLFYLYAFLMFRLSVAFAWPVSLGSVSKGSDKINNPEKSYSRDVSFNPRWVLESHVLSKRNATNNLVDPAGNDIPDGDITNEDTGDILSDRYGLLAIVLGVAAFVLLLLVLLVLLLAYHEQRKEAKYKELSGSDDGA
ncbi:unnamed protein product [Rhizoctonia solani]|uniref:Uncharacterized protein n=1 Tax=Rhizoctonia solani TaxID=456999 RepID=A0A8H3HQM3_9AGAM|nr:unnamed protein product [Rhizoctonia solani]